VPKLLKFMISKRAVTMLLSFVLSFLYFIILHAMVTEPLRDLTGTHQQMQKMILTKEK